MIVFDPTKWHRTCQSCGYKQNCAKPNKDKELTQAYTEAKCKHCKSADLDYGTTRNISDDKTN